MCESSKHTTPNRIRGFSCKVKVFKWHFISAFKAHRWNRPDRTGIIKRELILEILGTGSLTEKEILRQIGDNRYSREIVRKLLQDGLIYRVGKVRLKGCGSSFFKQCSLITFAGWCKRSIQICCSGRLSGQGEQTFSFSTHTSYSIRRYLWQPLHPSTKDWLKQHSKYTHIWARHIILSLKTKFDRLSETTLGSEQPCGAFIFAVFDAFMVISSDSHIHL